MTPLVSAIVLCTRAGKDAAECVLEMCTQKVNGGMEILVVDNHSQDDSIGIVRNRLKNFPDVRILEAPRNLGFGKGYDIGIRTAQGAYILINNPVKRLTPGSLQKMIDKMEEEKDIGILAPKLTHGDGSARFSPRSFPRLFDVVIKRTFLKNIFKKQMDRYLQLNDTLDRERDTDWVGGGCILVRKSLIDEIGSFDPRYFLFFEDIDLCRRTWDAGYRVTYFPQAEARDRKKRFSEMSAMKMPFNRVGRAHIASAFRYFWKWKGLKLPR
jgi:N-acetylglucosaminyl-diphospho-decaprenol L-rhamnosyltransferase